MEITINTNFRQVSIICAIVNTSIPLWKLHTCYADSWSGYQRSKRPWTFRGKSKIKKTKTAYFCSVG